MIPGPIVEDIVTLRRYLPFAADGLALTTLSTSACALSMSFCVVERDLADRGVHDTGLVDAELDLAGLDFLDRPGDVDRDRSGLRVRHQAARAEHLTELADGAHHVRRRDDRVEVGPAALDLVDQLLAADEVGAGLLRFFLLVAAGNRQHALALAEPVRQDDGAADHLIGVLRIDAKAKRELDRLVELRVFHLLHQGNRILDRVRTRWNLLPCGSEFLACLTHGLPRWCERPTSGLPRYSTCGALSAFLKRLGPHPQALLIPRLVLVQHQPSSD